MKRLQASTITLILLFGGCTETDGEETIGNLGQEVNDFINSLPELTVQPLMPKTPIECTADCPEDGQEGARYCTYSSYKETGHYTEFIAFQPDSAALWPGSIIQGGDAQHGFFTPVGVARAPLTFSLSLENLAGTPVGQMEEPSLSAFRAERNKLLANGMNGSTPAAIDFEVTQIHSSSQVSLALGASVSWPGGSSVTAGFDFTSSDKRTKILVNYTQAYYTIDIDSPIEPKDFFAPEVTVEELSEFMDAENPPLYVQSITYGRRVVFTVESNESADMIRAALEAAYAASFDVEGKLELEYEKTLEESRIHAFVLGGSGAEAAGAIAGFEGLMAYITKGGDYSKDSPGAPIAYKLAYLDNAVTRFAFTTEYAERICERNRADLHVEMIELDHVGGGDAGSNVELYGYVAIRYPLEDDPVVDCETGGEVAYLWKLEDGQWLSIEEYSTWTPTSPTYVDLFSTPIGAEEQLCLIADIREEDALSGDDDFGHAERMVQFDLGWEGEHVLQPRGDNQNGVDVRLRILLD